MLVTTNSDGLYGLVLGLQVVCMIACIYIILSRYIYPALFYSWVYLVATVFSSFSSFVGLLVLGYDFPIHCASNLWCRMIQAAAALEIVLVVIFTSLAAVSVGQSVYGSS